MFDGCTGAYSSYLTGMILVLRWNSEAVWILFGDQDNSIGMAIMIRRS